MAITYNPNTQIPKTLTPSELKHIGGLMHFLASTATDEEMAQDSYRSTIEAVNLGIKAAARAEAKKPAPAPVALSAALRLAAQPATTAPSVAQQLRDEEVIRAAKEKYGDDYADPQFRAELDAWEKYLG
jgi:hypothetical protein